MKRPESIALIAVVVLLSVITTMCYRYQKKSDVRIDKLEQKIEMLKKEILKR